MEHRLTHCISTYNNLPYLKIAVKSVRENSLYKEVPFVIHAENCDDGTDEWLEEVKEEYNLTVLIEKNDPPVGIGGGMNKCADLVETEYINFLHSDFYVTKDWDKELMNVQEKYKDEKIWVNSFRIEPNMFNSPDRTGTLLVPPDAFGAYHYNFRPDLLDGFAERFQEGNDFEIPKGEGVSGLVKKEVWDEVGGNDSLFAPASWDDMDLFLRMLQAGVRFVMPTRSVVWHFGARGSHRLEENEGRSSKRQVEAERANQQKWIKKWGTFPTFDKHGMINGLQPQYAQEL